MPNGSAAQEHVRTRPVKAVRIHRFGGLVFDYGQVDRTKRVLVHGAAGNVGAYAVQLAKRTGAEVLATVHTRDVDYARTLGAGQVVDVQGVRFEERVKDVDVVLDTIGGETLDRSFEVLKPGKMVLAVDR